MTAWYVRPDASHIGTRTGAEYDTAWGGWTEIVWGSGGVVAGDTLYVCGAHTYAAIIATGTHGATNGSRVTIRGDYPISPGIILFDVGTYYFNVNKDYTTVTNLTIKAGNYACIALGGVPLRGVHIRDNLLSASGAATGALLRIQAFTTWSYVDCIIDGNEFSGGSGSVGGGAIQWYATTAASVTSLTNLQITNNTFTGCSASRATILLKALNTVAAGTKMVDIVVSGNTFRDCSAVMMEIYGPDIADPETIGRNTGIKVCDNVIHNQTEFGGLGGGIVLGGFSQSLTSGFGSNVVARNKAYELFGISGFVNLFYGTYRVFGNYADGIDTSTIDGNGVLFDHGCTDCEAFGNEFHNIRGTGADDYYSGGFGILVLDATNCKAYGNLVVNCVTGVAFGNKAAGQSANVFNNSFLNCSQAGAYLVGGAEITNNLVRNNIFTSTRLIPAVKNSASTWTGESGNCFHGFGSAQGHAIHASTVDVDPGLDADYRPASSTLKRSGTYLGGKDFTGKAFYSPPNIGAVDELTATPRYALRQR